MRQIVTLLLIIINYVGYAQTIKTISGHVRDAQTGEVLIGARVQVKGTEIATVTNSYGFFSLQNQDSECFLIISSIGYDGLLVKIDASEVSTYNFELTPIDNVIEEVVVSGKRRNNNVTNPQMGVLNFSMEEIKNVPTLFGERDVIKTIQMLPGVAKGGEGSSDFYVRGGGGDQNLILLDEATVYNASHLFGFFSTFNSDAIKDVEFYKGGIPSYFGGRLASVMDIRMIDGNNKRFAAEGGIGLIASRIKLEGPIVKDKSSFMLSGRRTYADLFLKLSPDETINKSKLYFYDLNTKLNYQLNERNTVYLSAYFGKDDLGYSNLFNFDWGNATATMRWNHLLNERMFSNTSLIYSDFTYNVDVSSNSSDFSIASKIENFNLKQDFSFYMNNDNTIRFGINLLNQKISPASLNSPEGGSVNTIEIEKRSGLDFAGYFSHELKVSNWLSVLYGIRFTDFMVKGPGTFYSYDEEGSPIYSEVFNSGEIIKHYFDIEPRLSMSYIINRNNSVKLSYNRVVQNLHQLTNTTSSLPTDQYVLSSPNIKPQKVDQVAAGFFNNFSNDQFEFSVESFYKKMTNQIDFRNAADLQANQFLEGELLFGDGRAYGLEFYLRKTQGALTGWLSYTLGKSERKFDLINNGTWFDARHDRTHDISLIGLYKLSSTWSLGGSFVFYTGNAVTFPSAKYELDGKTIYYYAERNGYRMPDYHRLDLSATFEPLRKNKKMKSSWTFSVYNAYNRKNAYIIDFKDNKDNPNITEAYKVALFGIIPSVTWNFKF